MRADRVEPTKILRVVVEPAAIVYLLRVATVGPLRAPRADEDIAFLGGPLPDTMVIDPDMWLAWCIAGLHVSARLELGRDPNDENESWLEVVGDAAKCALTTLVMRRAGGNITHAAESLRTSRSALRRRLQQVASTPGHVSPMHIHSRSGDVRKRQTGQTSG